MVNLTNSFVINLRQQGSHYSKHWQNPFWGWVTRTKILGEKPLLDHWLLVLHSTRSRLQRVWLYLQYPHRKSEPLDLEAGGTERVETKATSNLPVRSSRPSARTFLCKSVCNYLPLPNRNIWKARPAICGVRKRWSQQTYWQRRYPVQYQSFAPQARRASHFILSDKSLPFKITLFNQQSRTTQTAATSIGKLTSVKTGSGNARTAR